MGLRQGKAPQSKTPTAPPRPHPNGPTRTQQNPTSPTATTNTRDGGHTTKGEGQTNNNKSQDAHEHAVSGETNAGWGLERLGWRNRDGGVVIVRYTMLLVSLEHNPEPKKKGCRGRGGVGLGKRVWGGVGEGRYFFNPVVYPKRENAGRS